MEVRGLLCPGCPEASPLEAVSSPPRAHHLPAGGQPSWRALGATLGLGWEARALTPLPSHAACNSTRCPVPVECPEGSHLVLTYEEGACCPSYSCSECLAGEEHGPGSWTWGRAVAGAGHQARVCRSDLSPCRLDLLQRQRYPVPGKNHPRPGPRGVQGPECPVLPASPEAGLPWTRAAFGKAVGSPGTTIPVLRGTRPSALVFWAVSSGAGDLPAGTAWGLSPKSRTTARRHGRGSPQGDGSAWQGQAWRGRPGGLGRQAPPGSLTRHPTPSPGLWSPRPCVKPADVRCLGAPSQTRSRSAVRPRSAAPTAPW